MVLIDALYINKSGGLELLKYLMQYCEVINLECKYIIDSRCASEFDNINANKKITLEASLSNRKNFYIKNKKTFSTILCFGNIPPPIKTNAIVYTYFHNIFLAKVPKNYKLINRVLNYLKKIYIRHHKKNTNFWIVQTENTKNIFSKYFRVKKERILILPFYKLESSEQTSHLNKSDYVYVANYTKEKNHDILVEAWNLLFEKGFKPNLHLTLSKNTPSQLIEKIGKSIEKGVNIINHGYLDKKQVIDLYTISKATVYPSENESLGLGIVEAIENGCDLIAPDFDYINTICIPSVSFKRINAIEIADAILQYEQGNRRMTKIKIKNSIDQLINLLK